MNISAIFIKRPIATTLLMLAIVVFGVAGYLQLPVNDLPNVDYPTITVNAGLPGANPDTMAAAVALPLEKQLSTIPGVEQMTSNSGQGRTNITLQFDLSRDIDGAAQDVQAAITSVRMPRDMPSPPTWRKSNPADQSDSDATAVLEDAAALRSGRIRPEQYRAAPLDDQRRGAGGRGWLAEVRGARAGRSLPTGGAADWSE